MDDERYLTANTKYCSESDLFCYDTKIGLITIKGDTAHVLLRQHSMDNRQILGLKNWHGQTLWRFRTYGRFQRVDSNPKKMCWQRIRNEDGIGNLFNVAYCANDESQADAKSEEFLFQLKEIPGTSITVELKFNH